MFRSRHFNQRHFSATYFDGAAPIVTGALSHFSQRHFLAKHFEGLQLFSSTPPGQPEIPLVVGSIAIEVAPSTVERGDPIVVIAYVYDQFNKAMSNVRVDFNSTNTAVLATPSHGFTDTLGRVVKVVGGSSAGTTNLYATASGYSAFTTVTITANVGGVTSTLTHGATIQPGNSGGGSPGPIKVKFTRRIRRWPSR